MQYPLTSFHFSVDWGGSRIGFSEVSGLDMSIKPIYYREGSSPNYAPSGYAWHSKLQQRHAQARHTCRR